RGGGRDGEGGRALRVPVRAGARGSRVHDPARPNRPKRSEAGARARVRRSRARLLPAPKAGGLLTMAQPGRQSHNADLVPIADRLRYMQAFRLIVGAAVGAITVALPAILVASPVTIAAGTLAYLLATGALYGLWQLWHRPALVPF